MTDEPLTEDQVQRGWQAIHKYTQDLKVRTDTEGAWPVAPGSALAGDDKATKPFNTSHLVQSLLVTSSDHLHALCTLIFEAQALHPFATSTMVRSSIEMSGSAAWVLQPKIRDDRVVRTVQLRSADERDRANAMKTWGLEDAAGTFQRAWVEQKTKSLGRTKLPHVTTSAILQDLSDHVSGGQRLNPFSVWQLASGFAHGRQWAALALLEREMRDAKDVGVVDVRFTISLDRLLPLAWVAMKTLEHAVDLFETRSSKPVPPGARRTRVQRSTRIHLP